MYVRSPACLPLCRLLSHTSAAVSPAMHQVVATVLGLIGGVSVLIKVRVGGDLTPLQALALITTQ